MVKRPSRIFWDLSRLSLWVVFGSSILPSSPFRLLIFFLLSSKIAAFQHGGFLKSLLTWDNGEHFSPFANAEIRAYELRLAEVDPSLVKSKATAKGGEPLVHEVKDDHWTVIELEQLSMEELAKT